MLTVKHYQVMLCMLVTENASVHCDLVFYKEMTELKQLMINVSDW